MKKQLKLTMLSAAVMLLASSTSFAHGGNFKGENYKGEPACPPPIMLKDGFYLGAEVGYDSYRTRENASGTIDGVVISSNPVTNPTGWVGGLFAGYGQYMDNFYLAGEIFTTDTGAQTSHNVNTYNSKITANWGYGLSLLPGYRLNNTSLFYVRLGYNWIRLKAQESTSLVATSTTNTSNGFNYGVGIETLVYENWSVRGEYTHTNYSSFTTAMGTSVSPSDNQFLLGVLYHFA